MNGTPNFVKLDEYYGTTMTPKERNEASGAPFVGYL
jgi:hypothetical protein